MSLIGEIPQSDSSYPAMTLMALEGLREWLQGGTCDRGLINFVRVLENMRNRTEFQPSYWSNQPEPMVVGGRLEYREPVWKLVQEVSSKFALTPVMSQEECADWLLGLCRLSAKYRKIRELTHEFTAKLQKEGVSTAVGNKEEGDVRIILCFGESATPALTKIVDRLIGELSVRIEQMGS